MKSDINDPEDGTLLFWGIEHLIMKILRQGENLQN